MKLRIVTVALTLAVASATAALGQLVIPPRRTVANRGTCVVGKPRQVFVTNGTSADDCSAGGGSTEVLCCCANGAWAACGSGGGGATFTSLDADYGPETVTSVWDLSGAKIRLPNGTTLTGADCDASGEAGRVFVDTDATSGQQVYVCEGTAGWKLQGDGSGGGTVTVREVDGSPSLAASVVEFLQSDGFAVSNQGGGVARVSSPALSLRGVASETGPVNSTTATRILDVVELNGLSVVDSLLSASKTLKFDPVLADSSTYGNIKLTGDLDGFASSPQVVNDSHTHGTSTIGGLSLANDFTSSSGSSSDLASILTDETGTGGGFVRATGPTLSAPVIGNYVRWTPAASPPVACSGSTEGAVYYDSTDHDFCECVGASPAWRSAGGAGSCS